MPVEGDTAIAPALNVVTVVSRALPQPASRQRSALLPAFPSHRFGGIQSTLSAMYSATVHQLLEVVYANDSESLCFALLNAGRSKAAKWQ